MTRTLAPPRSAVLPGLVLALALGGVATGLGTVVPLVGAPVLGILLGAVLSGVARRPSLAPGVSLAGRRLLPAAVVLLGAQLSVRQIADVGAGTLPVMVATIGGCLALAWLVGRRLGIDADLRTLIGVGTAICGASAIAAAAPVLRARGNDIAYALSTIFLFNVAAVLAFPPLGHLLGMPQHAFGVFAGTAVNDTSSVVAAASTYGSDALRTAVVVKLTRSLMIVPICLGLAALHRGRGGATTASVPWFLVGFLVLAAANSAGLVPHAVLPALLHVATFLVTAALAAIGLSTDAPALRRAGARPLLLGGLLWVAVSGISIGVQAVLP